VRSIESLDLELRSVMGVAASEWNERLSPTRSGSFSGWTEERRESIPSYNNSNGIKAFLQSNSNNASNITSMGAAPVRVSGGSGPHRAPFEGVFLGPLQGVTSIQHQGCHGLPATHVTVIGGVPMQTPGHLAAWPPQQSSPQRRAEVEVLTR